MGSGLQQRRRRMKHTQWIAVLARAGWQAAPAAAQRGRRLEMALFIDPTGSVGDETPVRPSSRGQVAPRIPGR